MDSYILISRHISNVFSCISRSLEILFIVFLTKQYFCKKSTYKSAYFVILNVGYIIDIISFINWLLPLEQQFYQYTVILLEWYNIYFITIWNVTLCLNRYTALVFYLKYHKIWTRKIMFFAVILMLVFPFAVDGYQLFDSNCSLEQFEFCQTFRQSFFLRGTILFAILNLIMVTLMTFSMFHSRNSSNNSNNNSSIQAKSERRLINQAIGSSLFLFICFTLQFASAKTVKFEFFLFMLFMYISNTVYYIHHLVVMGSHLFLSHSFRIAFLKFYRLSFLIPKTAIITIGEFSRHASPTKMSSFQRTFIS